MSFNLKESIKPIVEEINRTAPQGFTLMEVCGTHTMSIARYGLRTLLSKNIGIISGPGCPVCVTPASDINIALELAKKDDVIIASFGDMVRVPCNGDCLNNYRNVKIIYSPLDAIKLSEQNLNKEIVFIGIGFETTTPLTTVLIKNIRTKNIKNISILSMHKLVPPALELIMQDKRVKLNGFLLPGHVSAITGSAYFDFIKEYKFTGVVSGFDPLGVLSSIKILINKNLNNEFGVFNNYSSVVSNEGNVNAQISIKETFDVCDSDWRGIGIIKNSGLKLKKEFSELDAELKFNIARKEIKDLASCLCGSVLKGLVNPTDCKHYGKECTPSNPLGPCMVSSEGTCAAYFKYIRE